MPIRRSLLPWLLLPAALSGCAAIFERSPDGSEYGGSCTTSYGGVIADIIFGTLATATGGLGVAVGASAAGEGFGAVAALGAVGVVGGIAHFVSAGTSRAGDCRRLKRRARHDVTAPEAPAAPDVWRDGTQLSVAAGAVYQDTAVQVAGGTVDAALGHDGRIELGVALSMSDDGSGEVTSLAPRLVVEPFARGEDLGLAVRLRPAWSWSGGREGGDAWRGMLVALMIGSAHTWVDFGGGNATALDDMRRAHLQIGWRTRHYRAQSGLALHEQEILCWDTQAEILLGARWTIGLRFELSLDVLDTGRPDFLGMALALGHRFAL